MSCLQKCLRSQSKGVKSYTSECRTGVGISFWPCQVINSCLKAGDLLISCLAAQVTSGTDSFVKKDLFFPLPRPTSKLSILPTLLQRDWFARTKLEIHRQSLHQTDQERICLKSRIPLQKTTVYHFTNCLSFEFQ